ncbi:hypothetical protein J437_LFUL012106, partial [Ladona fulva]
MPVNVRKSELEYEIQLPFGPPPVLPDVKKELQEYLLNPDKLPIHDFQLSQRFWKRNPNPSSLYDVDLSPLGTTIKVERDPTTGEMLGIKEVALRDVGANARNSASLSRAPGPPSEAVRGSVSNVPFWPAGIPKPPSKQEMQVKRAEDGGIDFENDLLTCAPGMTHGYEPEPKPEKEAPKVEEEEKPPPPPVEEEKVDEEEGPEQVVNLAAVLQQEQDVWSSWNKDKEENKENKPNQLNIMHPKKEDLEKDILQAILLLEEKNHVFVSAHTSAGKTVVAEYAIALAMRNKTRVVYTSPIKALSNQKYRDFKTTFQDVGLITGDIQINQTASCLIMTTEILRSMLYRGSDTLRDLEFVIFDEVHYINDSERGHVWEEVLIQLQENVTIVMLSATVPNTLEFAQWVGQTVGKKVYVISTLKRPVPLEHYLYTGTGGASRDNCFLIVDAEEKFVQEGFYKAVDSLKVDKPTPSGKDGGGRGRADGRGRGGRGGGGGPAGRRAFIPSYKLDPVSAMKQEKTLWLTLLDFLKRNDKLPTVIFTLSRKMCDQYAEAMASQSLNTESEKSRVHRFFKHSLRLLKEPDRKLPQVVKMQELLEKGIGVHHSGILPILKEIVEIMFAEKKVK